MAERLVERRRVEPRSSGWRRGRDCDEAHLRARRRPRAGARCRASWSPRCRRGPAVTVNGATGSCSTRPRDRPCGGLGWRSRTPGSATSVRHRRRVDRASVFFDFAFETLERWEELDSVIDAKTVAVVAGQGEGIDATTPRAGLAPNPPGSTGAGVTRHATWSRAGRPCSPSGRRLPGRDGRRDDLEVMSTSTAASATSTGTSATS
jgi:hypothetical protein